MFCSKCGGRIPEGGEFCSYCGAKLMVNVEKTEVFREKSLSYKVDGPKVEPWETVFRARWQSAFPTALFVIYSIVVTLTMIIRASMFNSMLQGVSNLKMFGVSASASLVAFAFWVLVLGNFAYCILMTIGIWWTFAQKFDKSARPFSSIPYRLMSIAQYVLIVAYSVMFGAIVLTLMDFEVDVGKIFVRLLVVYGVLLTYHICGNTMIKRAKHTVEYSTANGLGYSVGMAVIYFIIAGFGLLITMRSDSLLSMAYDLRSLLSGNGIMENSGIIILAFHVLSGVMLIVLNVWRGRTQYEYFERLRKEREANQLAQPKTAKVGAYVPAWKHAQEMQKDE